MPNGTDIPDKLREFFEKNPRPAIAYSGGADSSYVLYAALASGADPICYFVCSEVTPSMELAGAEKTISQMGGRLKVLEIGLLEDQDYAANPPNRCYICKKHLFGAILKEAEKDGRSPVVDGTNTSDESAERPGMKALEELGIQSPLRDCGITKEEVRRLSREAGLSTWNLPSYSCLATRTPNGIPLTIEVLERTEAAEAFAASLGFRDFRIRTTPDGGAVMEIKDSQKPLLNKYRKELESVLLKYYNSVQYGKRVSR
ncbi:MAG: ATP-dependent sacrificial sulfur transferase LarE [Methanomethylophilus sp.]|jgi:uncharacterized protein